MLPIEVYKEYLSYEPSSGKFYWIKKNNLHMVIGKVAGYSNHRCVMIGLKNTCIGAHRLAWLFTYGKLPKVIDHIDRNPSNNRIDNLREATMTQNQINSVRKKSQSGARGVSKVLYKIGFMYRANHYLTENGKRKNITIGKFKTLEEASLAYQNFISYMHGEFVPK